METEEPGIGSSSPLFTRVCKETIKGIKFKVDICLTRVYNCRRQFKTNKKHGGKKL
jgi:hypothetical protein